MEIGLTHWESYKHARLVSCSRVGHRLKACATSESEEVAEGRVNFEEAEGVAGG